MSFLSLPICVVMCTSLLSVLLCTQQDRQQRGTHDSNTDRRYGHIPKENYDAATRQKAALYKEHPPEDGQVYDRNM